MTQGGYTFVQGGMILLLSSVRFAQNCLVISAGRRKYIHVGFAAASLLQRPAEITKQSWAASSVDNLRSFPTLLSLPIVY